MSEECAGCVAYTVSVGSRQLHTWRIGSTGVRLLQKIDAEDAVKTMAVHPAGSSLYVGTGERNKIVSFTIGATGTLSRRREVHLSGSPSYLSVSPEGSVIYSVSYRDGVLEASDITEDEVPKIPVVLLDDLDRCHAARVDPSGSRLWVTCLGEDRTRLYTIIRDDSVPPHLSYLSSVVAQEGSGPRHLEFHRNGRYAYILNEMSATLDVVDIEKNLHISGTVNLVPKEIRKTNGWASDLHLSRNGRWLYCCDRSTDTVTQFTVLKDGAELRSTYHLVTVKQPRSFDLDDRDRYLVISGEKSGDICVYELDRFTGHPTFRRHCLVGNRPTWVSVRNVHGKSSREDASSCSSS